MTDHERGRRKDGGNTVEITETGGKTLIDHSSAPLASPVVSSPVFDPDKYRHHVAHFDMPDDKKAELLFAVWQIMRSFVDRAFGDDPVQLAVKARDVDALDAKDETAAPFVVASSHKQTQDSQHDLTSAFQLYAAGSRGEEDSTA